MLLFKGSGDSSDTNNYRGINISCSLYNLLDKIMKTRIYCALSDDIPCNQYGFTRGKSTINAVKLLLDDVNKSVYVNKKPKYALFLDVKKAFDSINREFIFEKITATNKLALEELQLLAEMLESNFLIINDGVSQSNPILQTNGVRQGSSLSPFLFIFALSDINDILKDFPDVKLILYADDIVLLCENLDTLKIVAEKISAYLRERDLELNAKKSKVVKFKNKGLGRYALSDVLHIEGEKVEFVNEFKYLGVTLQVSAKSFSKHVAKRVNAAVFASYKLKQLPLMSIEAGLKLFDLAIAPVASYGIEAIWPYLSVNDLNKLETAKSRFLKRLLSVKKTLKSRFTYQLADCDLFVSDLVIRYKLPTNEKYETFVAQHLCYSSTIENEFYDTPAMIDNK
jgi:hypothetical protein